MIGIFTLLLAGMSWISPSPEADPPGSRYLFGPDCQQVSFLGIQKLILVEARVNDQTGWFILDTGMKDLLLNRKHFKDQLVEGAMDSLHLIDAYGEQQPTVAVNVDHFSWGEIKRNDFWARATLLGEMEDVLERRILGLIGMEVVRNLEVIVDYGNSTLTLRDPFVEGGCGGCMGEPDYEIPFAYLNHLPAIKTQVARKEEMWLGLDTGSSLSMLDKKLKQRMRRRTHTVTKIKYSSPNGTYEIPLANVMEVHIGQGLEFSYWRFGFNQMDHFHKSGMHIDGLLGGDLFRLGVVSLNFSQRKLAIWLRESPFLHRYPDLRAKAMAKSSAGEFQDLLSCVNN